MRQHSQRNPVSLHTILNILLSLLLAQAFLLAIFNKTSSPDLFLAFAAGLKTLQMGVASPDIWSFTAAGKLWVDQSWLSHLILTLSFSNIWACRTCCAQSSVFGWVPHTTVHQVSKAWRLNWNRSYSHFFWVRWPQGPCSQFEPRISEFSISCSSWQRSPLPIITSG